MQCWATKMESWKSPVPKSPQETHHRDKGYDRITKELDHPGSKKQKAYRLGSAKAF